MFNVANVCLPHGQDFEVRTLVRLGRLSGGYCVAPLEMVFLAWVGKCGSWHSGFLATSLISCMHQGWPAGHLRCCCWFSIYIRPCRFLFGLSLSLIGCQWHHRWRLAGEGFFCVSCLFTSVVETIATSASSIANLLWVVTWLADVLGCLLFTLVLLASSLRFFVRGSFAKWGMLPLCHGERRAVLM